MCKSPNIMIIKSRMRRCVGHVACTIERTNAYKILFGKPEQKKHLVDAVIDGRKKYESGV